MLDRHIFIGCSVIFITCYVFECFLYYLVDVSLVFAVFLLFCRVYYVALKFHEQFWFSFCWYGECNRVDPLRLDLTKWKTTLKSFDSFSVFDQLVESECRLFKCECKMRMYIFFYFCFTQAWGLSGTFCSLEIKFSMRMFGKCAHKLVICCESIHKRTFFLFWHV